MNAREALDKLVTRSYIFAADASSQESEDYLTAQTDEMKSAISAALDRLEAIEKRVKYIFHGTNAKLLDDGLVAGTYFTDDLEIALKFGKTVYAIDLTRYNEHFVLNEEGHYISRGFIPLDVMHILNDEEEGK